MTSGLVQVEGITAVANSGGTGAGVSTLNGLAGSVNITSTGATIAITTVGNNVNIEGTGGGTTSFSGITTGTNTTAAMAVGSGATLTYSGTGILTANNVAVTNEATDTTCFPLFATTATGDQAIKSNAGLTFNSNTGALGATSFVGPLTGNVTGNVSGSSGSTTGNAATVTTNANLTGPITSVGNATSIASQTGTGTTFVMSNSPTITTAILGSSTATTQTPGDNSTKLATTAYVQAALFATTTLPASKYATTAALPAVTYNNGASGVGATLTEVGLGALSIDGSTPSVNDIVLIKNQVSTFQNGIYSVTTIGSVGVAFVLTRTSYYNQTSDIDLGDNTFVTSGSTLANTTWTQNGTENPVLGTDPITFAQTTGAASYTAGNGISITGTSIAIDTAITVDKTTAQSLTNKSVNGVTLTTGGATTSFLNASGAYSTPAGGGSPGGSNTQVQYNNSSAFGGAAHLAVDTSGNAVLGEYTTTIPTSPPNNVTIFDRNETGGRPLLASTSGSNRAVELWNAPGFGRYQKTYANGFGNANIGSIGLSIISATTGTPSVSTYTGNTFQGSVPNFMYTSAATAGSSTGFAPTGANSNAIWKSTVAGCGGWDVIIRFGIITATATNRIYVGFSGATSDIGNVDPSSLTNIIAFGCDAADANMQFIWNDGSGTASKIDLGSSFPAKTSNVWYEARIHSDPNGTTYSYSLERLDPGGSGFTNGTVSTDQINPLSILTPQFHFNNGTTASAVVGGFITWTLMSDY